MQVQTDDVIRAITAKNLEAADAKLKEKNWAFNEIKATAVDEITVTVPDGVRNDDIIAVT
jgi:hypothetical protein